MTKQTIFVGSLPNDGTGDTLRNAMVKANANFTELYELHSARSHAEYSVPYGGVGPVTANDTEQFAHDGSPVEFTITTTSVERTEVLIILSAPSILLSGAQGPIVIQRVVGGVGTYIHGFIVSSIDNGYRMVYEDVHGQSVGTEITYKLINITGSGGVGGVVQFPTTYGFQFCGREI
jgi:hypothetical protein